MKTQNSLNQLTKLLMPIFLKYSNQNFNIEVFLNFLIDVLNVIKNNQSLWHFIRLGTVNTIKQSFPKYLSYLQICEKPIFSEKNYQEKWCTRIQINCFQKDSMYLLYAQSPDYILSLPQLIDKIIQGMEIALEDLKKVNKQQLAQSDYLHYLVQTAFCLKLESFVPNIFYLFTLFGYPICIQNANKDPFWITISSEMLTKKSEYKWISLFKLASTDALVFFPDITAPNWEQQIIDMVNDTLFQESLFQESLLLQNL